MQKSIIEDCFQPIIDDCSKKNVLTTLAWTWHFLNRLSFYWCCFIFYWHEQTAAAYFWQYDNFLILRHCHFIHCCELSPDLLLTKNLVMGNIWIHTRLMHFCLPLMLRPNGLHSRSHLHWEREPGPDRFLCREAQGFWGCSFFFSYSIQQNIFMFASGDTGFKFGAPYELDADSSQVRAKRK